MQNITINFLFERAAYIINTSIVTLIGVATLVFMYGIIQYVIAQGDEKKLQAGKSYMLYGIIGLTVIVAVWGFVNLIVFTIFGGSSVDPFTFSMPDYLTPEPR